MAASQAGENTQQLRPGQASPWCSQVSKHLWYACVPFNCHCCPQCMRVQLGLLTGGSRVISTHVHCCTTVTALERSFKQQLYCRPGSTGSKTASTSLQTHAVRAPLMPLPCLQQWRKASQEHLSHPIAHATKFAGQGTEQHRTRQQRHTHAARQSQPLLQWWRHSFRSAGLSALCLKWVFSTSVHGVRVPYCCSTHMCS